MPSRLVVALSTALGVATPPAGGPTPAATPVERVEAAIARADDDPATGTAELARAVEELQRDAARLADDPRAGALRSTAQLTLARAFLAADDPVRARQWMDEAIRTARGDPLPVEDFGPGLTALSRERAEALAQGARGEIEVSCSVPCRVLVNERPAGPHLGDLPAGFYRVHVGPAGDGSAPPLETTVELTGRHEIRWPTGTVQPSAVAPPSPGRDRAAAGGRRLLPRWSEIAALVAGALAVGAGAALVAIDGRCPGGDDPLDTQACPQVYTTRTGGIAALSAGGAFFVLGGVMLAVDEVRVRGARDARISLHLRARF